MTADRIHAGLLCAVLALLPATPPEHVHEIEEGGRVHVVVHQHLEPHGLAHGAVPTIDDDDPILTLAPVFTVPPSSFTIAVPPRQPGASIEPPLSPVFATLHDNVEQLIHGPPRAPTPLRGPPPITRL